MTVEHTEVTNYEIVDARPAAARIGAPTTTTAYQTTTITDDAYAAGSMGVFKLRQVIYFLFGILEGLLGIRFALGLFGANPAAGFAQFIYGATAPFIAPFVGLFGQPRFEGFVFEWNALVAIIVYALLAWVIAKVVMLVMGNTLRGI